MLTQVTDAILNPIFVQGLLIRNKGYEFCNMTYESLFCGRKWLKNRYKVHHATRLPDYVSAYVAELCV